MRTYGKILATPLKTLQYLIQTNVKPGRFYILPKIHKTDNLERPIVSSNSHALNVNVICLPTEHLGVLENSFRTCPCIPGSNWNLEMLGNVGF